MQVPPFSVAMSSPSDSPTIVRSISSRRAPVARSIDQTRNGAAVLPRDEQPLAVERGAGDAARRHGAGSTRTELDRRVPAGAALAGVMSAMR